MSTLNRRRYTAAFITLLGGAILCTPTHAVLIQGNTAASTEQTGSNFTGNLEYDFTDANTATLTLDLTNTTPAAVGGFLTAFVLNNPGDNIDTVTLSAAPTLNWSLLGLSDNGVNGAPFGDFDFGATSGSGGFEGGGNPNTGLAAGDDGTFEFSLTGTALDTLNEQSFLNELSSGASPGNGAQFFVARFRGLANDGSDKVPAIPEPSTYAMMLAGLGLLALGMRRMRS
jgi:hypothetical protein